MPGFQVFNCNGVITVDVFHMKRIIKGHW